MIKRALVLAEGTSGDYVTNLRSLGSAEVKARLTRRGWQTEMLEHTFFWRDSGDRLFFDTIDNFFTNADDTLVALSASIQRNFPFDLEPVLIYIKEKYPNTKIILGGVRSIKKSDEKYFLKYFDAIFIGRSMEMFEDYLNGDNMLRYTKLEGKPFYLNTLYNFDYERPLVCDLLDESDFLSKNDVVGFEIGLGCKFNCSFCNYPMRNSKTLHLSSEDAIVKSLQTAYDKYGITNFFVADDTVNEADEKLELLQRAVKRLSFVPNLGGFVRMDVLANRPHQIQMFKDINFVGYLFGVETFDEKASKLIRKKHMRNTVEKTIMALKKEMPHAWTGISLIAGLEHDNIEELANIIKSLTTRGIVDNIDMGPLVIHSKDDYILADEGFLSDMDKNPEKFGYKMKDGNWTNSTTNETETREKFYDLLYDYLRYNSYFNFNGFTFLSLLAFGLAEQYEPSSEVRRKFAEESLWETYRLKLSREISKYITKKAKQIKQDYGT